MPTEKPRNQENKIHCLFSQYFIEHSEVSGTIIALHVM